MKTCACLLALVLAAHAVPGAASAGPAADPSPLATAAPQAIDAPELARPGDQKVGWRTLHLVQAGQADLLAFDPATNTAPLRDRVLDVDLWYPARVPQGAHRVHYEGDLDSLPGQPRRHFTIAGYAYRDAPAAGRAQPLVLLSHGLANETVALAWLAENLASKGYVVAAIRHHDPPITDTSKFPQVLLRRPLDIAFVAQELRARLGNEGLVDPERIALIGYSMGGYGVLTAAGALPDPDSPVVKYVPAGLFRPYVRGGASAGDAVVPGVRAVVAISPAGGGVLDTWGHGGLAAIHAPLLFIAGDHDLTVDYRSGARAFLEAASGADRWLLTFLQAGHALGFGPAPEEMTHSTWDLEWFEDPVWRKDMLMGVELHFITAFLDRYMRDDATRAAYLDVAVEDSGAGQWPAPGPAVYGDYSPGTDGVTVWKGFRNRRHAGLQLLKRSATTHG